MSAAAEVKIGELEDQIHTLKTLLRDFREECIKLTPKELEALPEYSCSLPTGTTIGKRWKKNRNAYHPRRAQDDMPDDWVMGEFCQHRDPKMVGIVWRRLVVQAVEACPKCGSTVFGSTMMGYRDHCRCSKCGHNWRTA